MRTKVQGYSALAVAVATLAAGAITARGEEKSVFFPKGTKDVMVYGSYATPTFGDDERYYSVGVSGGYYFLDNWSVNIALVGHGVDSSSGASGIAGETNLQFRWHFWTVDRWSFFIDAGCGFLYSDHQLPKDGDGTHWNFTPQLGLGATYQVQENVFVVGGLREFHVSNGGLQGSDRHPGSNSLAGYLGVMWTF